MLAASQAILVSALEQGTLQALALEQPQPGARLLALHGDKSSAVVKALSKKLTWKEKH